MTDDKFEKKNLKKKSQNISDWYSDVVLKAELADYGPARGTMVIRPYGYGIWEEVQKVFDGWIKELGVRNAYFPLFIPYSLIEKEKAHIKGFAPELAVVTHGGGKKLSEPLVVRPTSETIMYYMYKKWISSWRDLPILINQWNNVIRWELRTYLFIRTTEFLWQEGHTAHVSEKEADDFALKILDLYRKIYEEYFAMPVVYGIKSDSEKFAGAFKTYGIESLMPDGKVLQASTSHNLGQNFSKALDISYQAENGKKEYVWQTSWGLSTRSLGGMILVHGDDNGLVIPPKIAPIQLVMIEIQPDKDAGIKEYSNFIIDDLKASGVRTYIDSRSQITIGRKFNEWEIKGVPLRIEIGTSELKNNTVSIFRRDTLEKIIVKRSELIVKVTSLLEQIQNNLYNKANKYIKEMTFEAKDYKELKNIMKEKRGFIRAFWCEDPECEGAIKQETKATTRVRQFDQKKTKGKCVYCGRPAKYVWYFAQSY